MDSEMATAAEASKLKLSVKFGGRSIPVEIAAASTIKDLKLLLQALTNVLPRGQKLIFKGSFFILILSSFFPFHFLCDGLRSICCLNSNFSGKVLSDESTLASSDISDRSKIMLLASQGLHQGVCHMCVCVFLGGVLVGPNVCLIF